LNVFDGVDNWVPANRLPTVPAGLPLAGDVYVDYSIPGVATLNVFDGVANWVPVPSFGVPDFSSASEGYVLKIQGGVPTWGWG